MLSQKSMIIAVSLIFLISFTSASDTRNRIGTHRRDCNFICADANDAELCEEVCRRALSDRSFRNFEKRIIDPLMYSTRFSNF
ncbi:unnamed protein product [Hymenolepis diminuta]|uniref:Uncharacterized protein n=1 Tax=Hymenolepis diminuta TaxID=6216 RepID=A0A564Z779_HYMDI|nr:unnamed protein product [Hymenolepis diminuta]